MENRQIAAALFELADLLEMDRAPGFRVRAFRAGARAIEGLGQEADEMLEKGTLTDVNGIGEGIARRVAELCSTGSLAELEEKRQKMPPGLVELVRLPGMGAKTAELIWRELGISTLAAVEAAAREGKLR